MTRIMAWLTQPDITLLETDRRGHAPKYNTNCTNRYGADGPGMDPVSKQTSSTVKLPAVPVVAPICTESAWVVKVCVPLDANAVPKFASPVATNPSRSPLLPVPRFWWIPMR